MGSNPVSTMADFLGETSLEEAHSGEVKAVDMFTRLLSDHEHITRQLRKGVDTCDEKLKDTGTADLLTGVMEAHEKMARMLPKYLS